MEQQAVFDYIRKKYKVLPEYPWRRYPDYAVFRHADNNKWFVLSATVPRNKLGIPGADHVDVINVKVDDPFFRDMMIQENGIMPAYHMNKQHWITVLLDGTVQDERYRTVGHIKSDGTIQDSSYRTIGHVKSDGTVQDANYRTIGHADRIPLKWAAFYFFFSINNK